MCGWRRCTTSCPPPRTPTSAPLALSIGDELNPDAIKSAHWSDLAFDFGLNAGAFERARRQLAETVATEAPKLRDEARAHGWHHPCIETILDVIAARGPRLA